jgi:hypothetical protein
MGRYDPVVRTRTAHRGPVDLLLPTLLLPGEQIVWRGSPRFPGASAESTGQLLFGVPLMLVGLVAFILATGHLWEADLSKSARLGLGSLLLLSAGFVALGLRMIAELWRTRARSASRVYALTDRRILILERGRRVEIASIALANLGPMHLAVAEDRAGTIAIDTHSESVDIDMAVRVTRTIALENIADADQVLQMIEIARNRRRAQPHD